MASTAVITFKGTPGDETNREITAGEKQKLGHRRIDEQGEITYKKVPTNALMSAIQLGIANSIGSLASKPNRDLLLQDFEKIESVTFPAQGSTVTPSHSFGDFRFKTYAPIAFRYFRELFNIKPADFLRSICTEPLRELSNAGASGSIFYVSSDDQFIIKTVQHKEAEFLQKLLPGYYMNLQQNKNTFLPKFYGLFCYQSLGKNIRLLVMNNLLPQTVTMHEKYDIKGSTYKRYASKSERAKSHPTLKDLDFLENHKDGLTVDPATFDWLLKTIAKDCMVLEAFKIMDYSLLVGIHNVEVETGGKTIVRIESEEDDGADLPGTSRDTDKRKLPSGLDEDSPHPGRIMARNANGDRLILYLGIIDILQNYRLLKKLEHGWKAILHDADSISVHNPSFYAQRFLSFVTNSAFRKGVALKSSPSRRRLRKSLGEEDAPVSARDVNPIVSGAGRTSGRRTYRADTVTSEKEKKKTERLFASSKPEERGELLAEDEVDLVTRL